MFKKKQIEVWIEGYNDGLGCGHAYRLGTFEAKNLKDAVNQYEKDSGIKVDWHRGYPSIRGSSIYNNAKKARRHYG